MASKFNEMDKIKMDKYKDSFRSLIISSPNSLTIEQLRNDYLTFEGDRIDFKCLGFDSIIELIQNMDDVLSIPPNPNENSIVSLSCDTKSNHLIQLISRQKQKTKHGKPITSGNGYSSNYNTKYSNNKNYYNRSHYTPIIDLKPPAINNFKQSADCGGDHFNDEIFTYALNINDDETSNITIGSTIREDEFLNSCNTEMNGNMMRTDNGLNVNKNSNGIESHNSSVNEHSSMSEMLKFGHSNPKQEHSDFEKFKKKRITRNILFRIEVICRAYCGTIHFVDLYLVYIKLFNSVLEPKDFGYNSYIELFKKFDNYFEQKNNLLFSKIDFPRYDEFIEIRELSYKKRYSDYQNEITSHALKSGGHISLNIDQTLVDGDSVICTVSEAYSPTLFFIQLCSESEKLNTLLQQMESFYDQNKIKYYVQPEQVLVGSYYSSRFIDCVKQENMWRRVKIIREVNSMLVMVIQVDFGTMDYVPKEKLRFLKKEFCDLPCQAIHCCLYSYNTIATIEQNVTNAFYEIVGNNKIIRAQIDKNILSIHQNQVLHVTLFDGFKNINSELVIYHM